MSVLMKAILAKCDDCCCGDKKEVKECEISRCSLHEYRLGKNPNRKKRECIMSEEQLADQKERMATARASRKKP
jgi:hypothetical protein